LGVDYGGSVLELGAVLLSKDVNADLDMEIRVDAEDISVEGAW
jgi:hypothetical protein